MQEIFSSFQRTSEAPVYHFTSGHTNTVLNSLVVFTDAHCFAGLKNGDIPDTAITASSVYNNNAGHRPRYGRLDLRSEYTNSIGSWVAGRRKFCSSDLTVNQL